MTITAVKIVPTQFLTNTSAAYGTPPAIGVVQQITRAVFVNTDTAAHAITVNVVASGGSATASNEVVAPTGRILQPGETWVSPELAGLNLVGGDQIYAHTDASSAVTMTVSGLQITP
jgi:hypothetical protein